MGIGLEATLFMAGAEELRVGVVVRGVRDWGSRSLPGRCP